MKRWLFEHFVGGRRFQKEFKKQVRMTIVLTLGFTIAFTWRQTIFDLSQEVVKFFTKIENSSALSIFSSIFITIISLLLIYLTAHFLKDEKRTY